MNISKKDWLSFVNAMSKINEGAANAIVKYAQKVGFADKDMLVGYAYDVVSTYGNASASIAASMYDEIANLEGKFYEPAVLAETPDYGEVAKTVYGTLKTSLNPHELGGAVSRLVKRTGQDTLLNNALRDGAEFAWIPSGDTCPFCITLASRGWQKISNKALKNGHAEHIHANCDCSYMIRHDSDFNVAGYNPDTYLKMYEEADGKTRNDKINSMRRMQYAERKDVINAQKRAAYALRKQENNGIIAKSAANTGKGKQVKYDKDAVYKIQIHEYSEEVNSQLSESARKVAEYGSQNNYEYSAIIDLNSGKEVDFGTSQEPASVNYYYDFLNSHPDGKYYMVHNHNTEDGVSAPDMQELMMWGNLHGFSAVTNNGVSFSVLSNGKKSTDYITIEFESVVKGMPEGAEKEKRIVDAAIEKYSKGGIIKYDGRSK